MTIFDWLNEISYNKRPWSSFSSKDHDSFNSYMINRFISMKEDYIGFVDIIQKYSFSNKYLYEYYIKLIPKRKTYFRYIKPKKSEINSKLITILAKYFTLSEREIKENYHLIGKNLSQTILQNLGIDQKEIKILLK